jgi:hypothetical protein
MAPIYRSDGEWVAVFSQGYIFNTEGEWIGFAIGREVFGTDGIYLGFLSDDKRLLRKRSLDVDPPRRSAPPMPERINIPAHMPLAPMFRNIPYQFIDVFEAFPERLLYVSETKQDME